MAGRTGLSRHHTMKRSTASVHIVVTCLGTACHHMEPNRNPASQPAAASASRYMTDSVVSRNGTTIGYRHTGHGPGVVVLHGTAESSESHVELAEALADAYTVYLPDRRGRGLSGTYGQEYSVQREVDDLDALLAKTGAHYVFGVSTGAIICLEAARSLPAIQK